MKHHLRKEMKQRLATIGPDEAAERSRLACRRLIELPEFQRAHAVMIYLTIPQEVETTELALAGWQHGKTILAPRVNWDQRHMLAVEVRSLESGVSSTRYGLWEPSDGEPWPIEDIDLVVVPALAFDRDGHRLGRGGGFYDRFLAEPKMRAASCGLAFAEQLLDELPRHAHDWPVDILVTDREVLRFNSSDRGRGH